MTDGVPAVGAGLVSMISFPLGPLQIVEVMDQIHPSVRSDLDNRSEICTQGLVD